MADSAVVGTLIIPAMQKAGYSGPFSAALTAVSSTIGGIIPPSIIMILIASSLSLSVGALFAAGLIPGLLVGLALMLLCYIIAVIRNYERYEVPFTWRALGRAFFRSGLALLIPVILVGGIVSGIWGTVEAGAITACTAFIIGKVIYRTLSWREFFSAVRRAVVTTSSVFIIIAAAGPFGWMLNRVGALNFVEQWLLSYADNPILFALVIVVFMIFVGMVMDVLANIIVLGPTLVHVMVAAGYSRVPGGDHRLRRAAHGGRHATGGDCILHCIGHLPRPARTGGVRIDPVHPGRSGRAVPDAAVPRGQSVSSRAVRVHRLRRMPAAVPIRARRRP